MLPPAAGPRHVEHQSIAPKTAPLLVFTREVRAWVSGYDRNRPLIVPSKLFHGPSDALGRLESITDAIPQCQRPSDS